MDNWSCIDKDFFSYDNTMDFTNYYIDQEYIGYNNEKIKYQEYIYTDDYDVIDLEINYKLQYEDDINNETNMGITRQGIETIQWNNYYYYYLKPIYDYVTTHIKNNKKNYIIRTICYCIINNYGLYESNVDNNTMIIITNIDYFMQTVKNIINYYYPQPYGTIRKKSIINKIKESFKSFFKQNLSINMFFLDDNVLLKYRNMIKDITN